MLLSQPQVMWQHSKQGGLEAFRIFTTLFPRTLVSVLLLWSLWAGLTRVVPQFEGLKQWAVSVILLVTCFLALYTYFAVIVLGAGSPQEWPELSTLQQEVPENPYSGVPEVTENPATPLSIYTSHSFRNYVQTYRLCRICRVWKPDRCHHCSNCNRCFLRMDHHCPWFSCCIGFRNQKYFVQSLFYITVYCGFSMLFSGYTLLQFFVDEQYDSGNYLLLNMVFVFVLGLTFYCAVGVFLLFQLWLVLKNTTTIEFQDRRWGYSGNKDGQYEFDKNGKKRQLGHIYDVGFKSNWKSIMGENWVHWLFPINSTSRSLMSKKNNGVHFDINEEVFEKVVQNAALQEQLNRQLSQYRDSVVRPAIG